MGDTGIVRTCLLQCLPECSQNKTHHICPTQTGGVSGRPQPEADAMAPHAGARPGQARSHQVSSAWCGDTRLQCRPLPHGERSLFRFVL